MSRGKKLDIFIGANIDDGWAELQPSKSTPKTTKNTEPSKHSLVFKKEKRRGKSVTLVGEFHMPKNETTNILKSLKKQLGCGGTYKDNWMEFQGDIKDKLKELLEAQNFRFKH
jgi:translation initiation factor 1